MFVGINTLKLKLKNIRKGKPPYDLGSPWPRLVT